MRKLYRQVIAISEDGSHYTDVWHSKIFYCEYKQPKIDHYIDFESLKELAENDPFLAMYQKQEIIKHFPRRKIIDEYVDLRTGLTIASLFSSVLHIKSDQENINIYYKTSYKEVTYVTMEQLMHELDSKEFIQYLKDNDITTISQKGLININRRK